MECPHCSRSSRSEETCEWCGKPLRVAVAKVVDPRAEAATVQELEAAEPVDRPEPVSDASLGAAPGGVLARPWPERLSAYGIDRETLPILLLILLHVLVSVARGGPTLYSLPIVLWLVVGAGVAARQAWSMALALLLVCTEIAFAASGIAPDTVAGLPSWSPIDFLMLITRIATGLLIFRLRDELE